MDKKPNRSGQMWRTNVGREALVDYAFKFIDTFLVTDMIPEVILQSIKTMMAPLQVRETDPEAVEHTRLVNPRWETDRTQLLAELERVLQSDDYRQCLHDEPFERRRLVSPIQPTGNGEMQWQVRAAQRAIRNANAFDIYETILTELIKFNSGEIARKSILEIQAYQDVQDDALGKQIEEIASNQLERAKTKSQNRRLEYIEQHAQDRPGDILGSVVLDLLTTYACGQPTGPSGTSRVEEFVLECMTFDILVQRILDMDASLAKETSCLPISTYHATVNKYLFLDETLRMLVEHVDEDLADMDLTRICDELSDPRSTTQVRDLLPVFETPSRWSSRRL